MNRIVIALIILSFCLQPTHAQKKVLDSLNNLLIHSTSDTTTILLKVELASVYQFSSSDSAIILIEEAIRQAQDIDFKKGELRALSRRGELRHLKGQLSQALEDELQAIRLSQRYNFPDIEAGSLTFLATIYLDLEDYRKAHVYLFRAMKIYETINTKLLSGGAQQMPPYTLLNIGYVYEKLNMPDSAMWFFKESLNYPIKIEDQQRADLLTRIGILQSREQNYTDAITNFRDALNITLTSNDLINRSIALYQIALIHSEQNNKDSALHYANLAYKTGVKSSYKATILDASSFLAKLYEAKENRDSAFYYLQTAMNIKESLFGLDELHKLQALVLSEQQRMHQLEEDQALAAVRMQRAILLFFVVIFLLVAAVLLFFNRQQKKVNYILNEKNIVIEQHSENLKKTLHELKSTQAQLVQSEKIKE